MNVSDVTLAAGEKVNEPLALIVVRGVDRGTGVSRRQRDPQFFLLTLELTQEDDWAFPLPLAELLAELGIDAAEQAALAAQGAVLFGSADDVPRDWPERP